LRIALIGESEWQTGQRERITHSIHEVDWWGGLEKRKEEFCWKTRHPPAFLNNRPRTMRASDEEMTYD
jgi:hypothetical protein